MINRFVGVGRLVRDPELRYTPSGVATCSFTIAIDRPFKNSQGEKEADFIQVVAWRQLAELCANYLKKGSQTAVDARLQTRSYEKDGKRVYVTEIIAENVQFLTPAGRSEEKHDNYDPFKNDSRTIDISDDDIPF